MYFSEMTISRLQKISDSTPSMALTSEAPPRDRGRLASSA